MQNSLTYLQQLLQEHFINKEKKHFTQLVIPNSKKHSIEMHIQVFLLCEPHVSLLEGIYFSVQQALLSTSIPKMECFANEVTGEETVEMIEEFSKLTLSIQSLVLIGSLEGKFIMDMTPL